MNNNLNDTTATDTAATAKKAYHAPAYKAQGPVSEITETSSTTHARGDGGGTLPNIYAS